jgi:hypothetical protein
MQKYSAARGRAACNRRPAAAAIDSLREISPLARNQTAFIEESVSIKHLCLHGEPSQLSKGPRDR